MSAVLSIENVSKLYRLGTIGSGTLSHDLNRWWAKIRNKPDPMQRVGEPDYSNRIGDTIWALKDVSFQVQQGDVLGIIGRNGAGKSTLLKILSRVTAPTNGQVKIKGRIASLLEVGTGFHPELTGRENIYLNGAILGMTRAETQRKLDEIVAFAEIEKFIDTPVKRYSSGMYVRLAFAVAAHLETEILIVDEVLAVGDAAFQDKCLGKMGNVAHEGRTVLFVSHNMGAIQSICSTGILLESGKLVLMDNVQRVTETYLSRIRHNPEKAVINLEDWPDRQGRGGAKITRLEIVDRNGNPISQVSFCDFVRFRITCNFTEAMEATFGILIHSLLETPLIDLRSPNSAMKKERLSGQVIIEADVEALNLYPGEYYISPWIMDKLVKEDIDFVHYCTRLTITMPTGKGPMSLDPIWGKFFVDSKWEMKK